MQYLPYKFLGFVKNAYFFWTIRRREASVPLENKKNDLG